MIFTSPQQLPQPRIYDAWVRRRLMYMPQHLCNASIFYTNFGALNKKLCHFLPNTSSCVAMQKNMIFRQLLKKYSMMRVTKNSNNNKFIPSNNIYWHHICEYSLVLIIITSLQCIHFHS